MWADALRDGVCQHNPFTNLRLETPKGRKDLIALTSPRSDGGRLVQILYGHPDEERALDRLLMAFSADGRKSQVEATPVGHDPAARL